MQSKMATMTFRRVDSSMDDFIRVKFSMIAKAILFLPSASLFTCIAISCILHWEQVTTTHCKVPNYLPSLSAAIGDLTPQRYIWRMGIALHSSGRFLVAFIYLYFYKQLSYGKKDWIYKMAKLNLVLNVLENFSLLTLSYVSSKENFDIHEAAFICFIIFSMAYMVVTCFLFKTLAEFEKNDKLRSSYKWKLRTMIFYMVMFALSVYFYFRHNAYCEPGVYSLFALCEYLVVMANIFFHGTAVNDFKDSFVTIGPLLNTGEGTSEKYR
eukprot:Seg145.3 transcript_id=Seg145.3/GoldUCD/mRNA.D3Y31 product="Post-GPI attachment to proteins factor 2" protein_id=Seg145.3/GoldUCD/D3Y31